MYLEYYKRTKNNTKKDYEIVKYKFVYWICNDDKLIWYNNTIIPTTLKAGLDYIYEKEKTEDIVDFDSKLLSNINEDNFITIKLKIVKYLG